MPLTKYVQDWFKRAEDDIKAAELMLHEGGLPNPICFHAQQSAEKYLKGFLAFHEKHVRKIHDLEILIANCREIDNSFSEIEKDAVYLTQFYTEARYPGDFSEFTMDEAEGAYTTALKVKEFVLSKIKE